jgi:hypothetical protein
MRSRLMSPQARYGTGGDVEILAPTDRLLNHRIAALDAEARARDASLAEGSGHLAREGTRVDLDRNFGLGVEGKTTPQQSDEFAERARRHDGGRTVSKMDVLHPWPAFQVAGNQADLALQRCEILGDGRIMLRDAGVAAAIPAHRPAEWDVQVKRDRRVCRQCTQPCCVSPCAGGPCEIWTGRITCVTGQPLLAVEHPQILPHRASSHRVWRTQKARASRASLEP